ncbi:neutral zinc metallopeptidase [Thermobifida halotolerans]|uniref:Neutral zinc metallopeptidase n=2 Tax=Thermobifida halotolerans TaxID=483545 RepID=A0A399FYB9_9ACTN|nr:neutral zinc metallopeptidase [Thermobifida halotolerans]
MGLAAVALAGFVLVAALFDTGPRPVAETARPAATSGEETVTLSRETLSTNPLYLSGELRSVTCPAPELDADDPESMEFFLHEVTDCLDEAWGTHLADAGVSFDPPNRIYWYASGQSPCGTYPVEGTSAFYCYANKGLYLGVEDIVADSGHSDQAAAYTFLLGHEYGHHVQGEAGILPQYQQARGGGGENHDEWTRRSELQANCLSGVFLGSVGSSFPIEESEREEIMQDAALRADRGDSRTHGSAVNGQMWTSHGMDRRDPAACNTWEAEEELVD